MGSRIKPAVILLVEDDPGDQELTRRALEDGCIAELHVVEDGEEALNYLFLRGRYAGSGADCPRPDLILLDLNLPKLTGRQMLEQLQNDASLRHIPVVILTTSQQEKDIQQCYDSGASSYIVKPEGVDDFVRMVKCIGEYWFGIVRLPPVEGYSCQPPA